MRMARSLSRRFTARMLLGVLGASAVACGAAQTAVPEPSGELSPVTPAASAAPAAPVAASGDPPPPASDNESAAPPPVSGGDADPNATRNITYVVVPEGLKISVAGVKFTVTASSVQVASGWGVKLNVVASAVDGKAHSLSSPKAGPLAFAGSVRRKGQPEPESFGDERVGEGEQSVFGDDVTKFSRTWPAKGVRVLGAGDALDLQVALWGLGLEKEARRPVKKFCHVRMLVEKGKPRAIVEPPALGSGK